MKRILMMLVLAAAMGIPAAQQADAQTQHTIRIENGELYINGEIVPDDKRPESLKIEGVTARFNFTGDDRAFVEIGGQVYMYADDTLIEMDDSAHLDQDVAVYFSGEGRGVPVRFFKHDPDTRFFVRSGDEKTYAIYSEELFDQARKLKDLRVQIASGSIINAEEKLLELTATAENTARIAQEIPRRQFQAYLRSIGDQDASLMAQLQREQELEVNTRQLARQIRMAASSDERERLTEELRTELETIFQLKQQNREREIDQLAKRLEELEERLHERRELRDRIIDARMNELLGRNDW